MEVYGQNLKGKKKIKVYANMENHAFEKYSFCCYILGAAKKISPRKLVLCVSISKILEDSKLYEILLC